jgi:hypothetical protein
LLAFGAIIGKFDLEESHIYSVSGGRVQSDKKCEDKMCILLGYETKIVKKESQYFLSD